MVYYIYSEIKRTLKERFALVFLLGIVGASILANLSIIVFMPFVASFKSCHIALMYDIRCSQGAFSGSPII